MAWRARGCSVKELTAAGKMKGVDLTVILGLVMCQVYMDGERGKGCGRALRSPCGWGCP